jgi:hypothetical protein
MKRRDFFRQAGVGSAALVSLPGFAHALTRSQHERSDDDDDERTGFDFVCNSLAGTVNGVVHRITMNGTGAFSLSEVEGGGSYDHIDLASAVPKTILSAGTWKADRVLSFIPIGTYGVLAAGILEMDVTLHQQMPSGAVIPATLRIACGIGVADLDAGEPEGITRLDRSNHLFLLLELRSSPRARRKGAESQCRDRHERAVGAKDSQT